MKFEKIIEIINIYHPVFDLNRMHNNEKELIQEIEKISSTDELFELCRTNVKKQPPFSSFFSELIFQGYHTAAKIIIEKLSVQQRYQLCIEIFASNYSKYGHTELTVTIPFHQKDNIASLLIKDFSNQQKVTLCTTEISTNEQNDDDDEDTSLMKALHGHNIDDDGHTPLMLALRCKNFDFALALIKGLTPDERGTICTHIITSGNHEGLTIMHLLSSVPDNFTNQLTQGLSAKNCKNVSNLNVKTEKYPKKGLTTLTLLITQGLETDTTNLIKELSFEERLKHCNYTIPEGEHKGQNTLTLAIHLRQANTVAAFFHELNDDQITTMLQLPFPVVDNGKIYPRKATIGDAIVLLNLYSQDPLSAYIRRMEINLDDIVLRFLDTQFSDGCSNTGFRYAWKYKMPVALFSLNIRKKYLLSDNKPLYLQSRFDAVSHAPHGLFCLENLAMIDQWLKDFTDEERYAAVTDGKYIKSVNTVSKEMMTGQYKNKISSTTTVFPVEKDEATNITTLTSNYFSTMRRN